MSKQPHVSIILPAKNEAASLKKLLPELHTWVGNAEIILVDDGSQDATVSVAKANSITVISQPYPIGNGAAIKRGAREAKGEIFVFMDADGQHSPKDIPTLLKKLNEGYDMVVGARSMASQAGLPRAAANGFYNRLASWMVGQPVADLTSGFRVVRAEKFKRFLYLLPNGFSYPTTITMSFFRAGFTIAYMPITVSKRIGVSHIRPVVDGLRFLLIIFKIGTLYSPLKLFLPISVVFFISGVGNYLYTFLTTHSFTNMSALLLITSVLVFLIGLVSEQITMLNYKESD